MPTGGVGMLSLASHKLMNIHVLILTMEILADDFGLLFGDAFRVPLIGGDYFPVAVISACFDSKDGPIYMSL